MKMSDETFELLTRMYADFSAQFKELKDRVTALEIKLETQIDKKLDLLLETRADSNKRLDVLENAMDTVSDKVDAHDMEIKILKAAK